MFETPGCICCNSTCKKEFQCAKILFKLRNCSNLDLEWIHSDVHLCLLYSSTLLYLIIARIYSQDSSSCHEATPIKMLRCNLCWSCNKVDLDQRHHSLLYIFNYILLCQSCSSEFCQDSPACCEGNFLMLLQVTYVFTMICGLDSDTQVVCCSIHLTMIYCITVRILGQDWSSCFSDWWGT